MTARRYAASQREAFFNAVVTGDFKDVALSGPRFERGEVEKLWLGFLQRLGFRLATMDTGDFGTELGDDFCVEFLNNHSYVDYVGRGGQEDAAIA